MLATLCAILQGVCDEDVDVRIKDLWYEHNYHLDIDVAPTMSWHLPITLSNSCRRWYYVGAIHCYCHTASFSIKQHYFSTMCSLRSASPADAWLASSRFP